MNNEFRKKKARLDDINILEVELEKLHKKPSSEKTYKDFREERKIIRKLIELNYD